jgi:hypothetical protein
LPAGEPRRYHTSDGYIVWRWRVGTNRYVEVLEHRAVTGIPAGPVHHEDLVKTNNDPSNLKSVGTAAAHRAEHRTYDRERAASMYRSGATIPEIAAALGANTGTVSRMLHAEGVPIRRNWRLSPVTAAEVRPLYERGMRPAAIAAELGCSAVPVRRVMRENSMTAYPPGRPRR